MPADNFLKLSECPGESPDEKHKGEIELLSFTTGIVQVGSAQVGGGQGTVKSQFQDVSCVAYAGKHSPKLMEICANGKPVADAVVTIRKAGGDALEYMTWTMKNVMVSSYSSSQSGDELAVDNFTLNYDKIAFTYKEQDEKGGMKGQVKAGWDSKGGAKWSV